MAIGATLFFIGLLGTGFYLAECIFGDHSCFLELLVVTIPLAWIGHRLLRGYWRVALAVAGVVTVLIGLAIANPDSLRPRFKVNEDAAIRDLRTVISAEAAYASSNSGYYDRLECLARPAKCIPSYPADGRPFLAEPLDGLRTGFIREFIPGPHAGADVPSPSSLQSYAFIAYPANAEAGVRSFCGDSAGNFCFTVDGSQPQIVDGKCAPGCLPLE